MKAPIDFILAALVALMGWVVFMVIFAMHAESVCLANGYPKSSITYKLDVYCIALDGSVTQKVAKQ